MTTALAIECTRSRRGAVVRLLAAPVIKFTIEKDGKGSFDVWRNPKAGQVRDLPELTEATYDEATGYAIRECERIRDQVDRGADARP